MIEPTPDTHIEYDLTRTQLDTFLAMYPEHKQYGFFQARIYTPLLDDGKFFVKGLTWLYHPLFCQSITVKDAFAI